MMLFMKTHLPKESMSHKVHIDNLRDAIMDHCGRKIAFIILFGSFARGNWVHDKYDEDGRTFEYASDYDILVVMNAKKYNSLQASSALSYELEEAIRPYGNPHKPHIANVIVESVAKLNKMLGQKQYFFTDIKKEGIFLYDSGKYKLSDARDLSNTELKEIAVNDYEEWFPMGDSFLINCRNSIDRSDNKVAAFLLHQAAENFLHCSLLVMTGYKPKTHSLEKLTSLCASQSNEFLKVFPRTNEMERKLFKLLEEAYIRARYDKTYKITAEQLEYLVRRVEMLRDVTKSACDDRVENL